MTPKEKAEELADKFLGHAYDGISSAEENCIECALIAVDQVIEALQEHHWQNRLIINFWEEVKNELEKL
jgi:hypothetical protein